MFSNKIIVLFPKESFYKILLLDYFCNIASVFSSMLSTESIICTCPHFASCHFCSLRQCLFWVQMYSFTSWRVRPASDYLSYETSASKDKMTRTARGCNTLWLCILLRTREPSTGRFRSKTCIDWWDCWESSKLPDWFVGAIIDTRPW